MICWTSSSLRCWASLTETLTDCWSEKKIIPAVSVWASSGHYQREDREDSEDRRDRCQVDNFSSTFNPSSPLNTKYHILLGNYLACLKLEVRALIIDWVSSKYILQALINCSNWNKLSRSWWSLATAPVLHTHLVETPGCHQTNLIRTSAHLIWSDQAVTPVWLWCVGGGGGGVW